MRYRMMLGAAGLLVGWVAEARVERVPTRAGYRLEVTVEGVEVAQTRTPEGVRPGLTLRGVEGRGGVKRRESEHDIPVVRFWVEGNARVEVITPPVERSWPEVAGLLPQDTEASDQGWRVDPQGVARGVSRALVTLYPVAKSAPRDQVRWRESFRIEVEERRAAEVRLSLVMLVGGRFQGDPSIERLVRAKEARGWRVRVLNAGEDVNSSRARLRAMYAEEGGRLTHLLIVGDDEDVPAGSWNGRSRVTDLYYALMDADDEQFGAGAADLAVGRLSPSNGEDLRVMVDKVQEFEGGAMSREPPRAALVAGPDFGGFVEHTHEFVRRRDLWPLGWMATFPRAEGSGGDRLYSASFGATGEDVVESLARGQSLVVYAGHGSPYFWVDPMIEIKDLPRMDHDARRPLVLAFACETADFRVSESLGEAWTRRREGAIAYYGAIGTTHWQEDDRLEKALVSELMADAPRTLGEIAIASREELGRYYGVSARAEEYAGLYHILGDPTLVFDFTE